MQRKLSSPPTPYVLYYADLTTVRALQLPIKSREDATFDFHGVPADKVHGTPVQRTLPAGEELRAFVLAAQFLIEGGFGPLTPVDRATLLCLPSEMDQSRAVFLTAGLLGW